MTERAETVAQDTARRDPPHLAAPNGAPGHPHTDVPAPVDPTSTETAPLDVVVVTGLSGSGSTAEVGRVAS